MEAPLSLNLEKRNKIACIKCRSQKIRCDLKPDLAAPCSRCQRLNHTCKVSEPLEPLERTHKRKRISDLEEEVLLLRQKLASTTPQGIEISDEATNSTLGVFSSPRPSRIVRDSSANPNRNTTFTEAASTAQSSTDVNGVLSTTPLPRKLIGLELGSNTIRDLFAFYFNNYASLLPVLNSRIDADRCYDVSPMLFWAIATVGSRRYLKNPTILGCLSSRVRDLALKSLGTGQPSLPDIKGTLLILTWPGPVDSKSVETSFSLTGLLIHAAMQIGLHMPSASQDFFRDPIKLTARDIKKRYQIWVYCMLTYHRWCTVSGQAPSLLNEKSIYQDKPLHAMTMLPASIRVQIKSHIIVANAMTALNENGLSYHAACQSNGIEMILRIFKDRLMDLESESMPLEEIDKLYLSICRMHLQTMHFYEASERLDSANLVQLHITSCATINLMRELDASSAIISSSTSYMFHSLLLAATNLLRLLRGLAPQSQQDYERGEATFFLAVTLMTRMSIANDDLPGRCSNSLSKLWTSQKLFKRADGSLAPEIRIRTRLIMSPLVDCLWWYREEFRVQRNVYPPSEPSNKPTQMSIPYLSEPFEGTAIEDGPSQQSVTLPPDGQAAESWEMCGDLSLAPWPSFFDFNDFLT